MFNKAFGFLYWLHFHQNPKTKPSIMFKKVFGLLRFLYISGLFKALNTIHMWLYNFHVGNGTTVSRIEAGLKAEAEWLNVFDRRMLVSTAASTSSQYPVIKWIPRKSWHLCGAECHIIRKSQNDRTPDSAMQRSGARGRRNDTSRATRIDRLPFQLWGRVQNVSRRVHSSEWSSSLRCLTEPRVYTHASAVVAEHLPTTRAYSRYAANILLRPTMRPNKQII